MEFTVCFSKILFEKYGIISEKKEIEVTYIKKKIYLDMNFLIFSKNLLLIIIVK